MSGRDARDLACNNTPASNWTNVLYGLTETTINVTEPPPYEPRKLLIGRISTALSFFVNVSL